MLRLTGGPNGHEHGWVDTELSNRTTTPDIAGWRPTCVCGWRGPHLHRRHAPGTEQPGDNARLAMAAEWQTHIAGVQALAELLAALADHRATLDRLEHQRREADRRLLAILRPARDLLTWQQIADGLGTSRQAAEQRLAKLLRRATP